MRFFSPRPWLGRVVHATKVTVKMKRSSWMLEVFKRWKWEALSASTSLFVIVCFVFFSVLASCLFLVLCSFVLFWSPFAMLFDLFFFGEGYRWKAAESLRNFFYRQDDHDGWYKESENFSRISIPSSVMHVAIFFFRWNGKWRSRLHAWLRNHHPPFVKGNRNKRWDKGRNESREASITFSPLLRGLETTSWMPRRFKRSWGKLSGVLLEISFFASLTLHAHVEMKCLHFAIRLEPQHRVWERKWNKFLRFGRSREMCHVGRIYQFACAKFRRCARFSVSPRRRITKTVICDRSNWSGKWQSSITFSHRETFGLMMMKKSLIKGFWAKLDQSSIARSDHWRIGR